MAKKKEEKKQDKVSKKEFRKEVMEKLSAALAVYKQDLGEKKFKSRVRKASKLFSQDLDKVAKKNGTAQTIQRREGVVLENSIPA